MKEKLQSRKFWICAAAFLASMSTGIAGAASNNEVIAGIGIVCGIFSTAIYAACEAAVDRARLYSNPIETRVVTTTTETNATTQTQTHTVEAKSDDVLTVATVLAPAPIEEQQPVMEDE